MIEELRQRVQALQRPPGIEDDPGVLPFGVEAIDAALGGGLARGALHEIAASSEAHVATAAGFVLGLSSASCPAHGPGHDGRHLVWIAEDMALTESGTLHGPGLDAFGLMPERLVTVQAARTRDLLWAMEEALRCRAVAAVIGEMRAGEIDGVAVRRLSLAAAESGVLAFLLRAAPPTDASTAATRWIVGASPSVIPGRTSLPEGQRRASPESITPAAEYGFRVHGLTAAPRNDDEMRGQQMPRFSVSLVRNRRGPVGSWILEWSDIDERFLLATHAQPVAAPPLHRPHRKVA